MQMMPITTTSVRRKLEALRTIWPRPAVAATISAATSVVQPTPIPMRSPTRISGRADSRTTWRITCSRLAPMERAALICSWLTERTPARAESATGAKQARKISSTFESSDAEPDDHQGKIGERRQRSVELDWRIEDAAGHPAHAHGEADRDAEYGRERERAHHPQQAPADVNPEGMVVEVAGDGLLHGDPDRLRLGKE